MLHSRNGFRRSSGPLERVLGVVGGLCLAISVIGLGWSVGPWRGSAAAPRSGQQARVPAGRMKVTAAATVPPDLARSVPGARGGSRYYPLAVGRFWVYTRRDPETGVETESERRVVRRERGPQQDLYYFADGGMAFMQGGKIFEIGPRDGVNVVPVAATPGDPPYVYLSQGLHIEKSVGTRDTTLLIDGHRYAGCLQVVTRFRRADRADTLVYASYYAPGVGLISREAVTSGGRLRRERLRQYGPRSL